jgi:hypothetical protein
MVFGATGHSRTAASEGTGLRGLVIPTRPHAGFPAKPVPGEKARTLPKAVCPGDPVVAPLLRQSCLLLAATGEHRIVDQTLPMAIVPSAFGGKDYLFLPCQPVLDAPDDDVQVSGPVDEIQVVGADGEDGAELEGLNPLLVERL